MAKSQRWTEKNPLIFGHPDGRAVAATATSAIRGLRPGDTFFASGDRLEAGARDGFFVADEPAEIETAELLPQAPPPDPPAEETPPPKPKRAPAKKAAGAKNASPRFKRTPAPPS